MLYNRFTVHRAGEGSGGSVLPSAHLVQSLLVPPPAAAPVNPDLLEMEAMGPAEMLQHMRMLQVLAHC